MLESNYISRQWSQIVSKTRWFTDKNREFFFHSIFNETKTWLEAEEPVNFA